MAVIDLRSRTPQPPTDDPLAILKAAIAEIESGKRPLPAAMLLLESDGATLTCSLVNGDSLQALGLVTWAYTFLAFGEDDL